MNVKDIIRERRVMLGLTMKEVADKVGVSEATISRWESGEIANMRRRAISSLSKALIFLRMRSWGGTPPPTAPPWLLCPNTPQRNNPTLKNIARLLTITKMP